jgi:hypothetical protein
MRKNFEQIFFEDHIIAIIIRASYEDEEHQFVTEGDSSLQLGIRTYPKNHKIEPHEHPARHKIIDENQEFLYITSGVIHACFYFKKKLVSDTILEAGDMLLQMYGGHSFEVVKESKIVMIKQGPYAGAIDKSFFKSKEK